LPETVGIAGPLGREKTAQVTSNWDHSMRVAQVRARGMAAMEPRMTGSKNRLSYEVSAKLRGDYMSLSNILIPVDGSPASLRAVDFAIERHARNGTNALVLLHVQPIGSINPAGLSEAMPADWLHEATSQASAQALKDAIGKCEGASVAFKALARSGQTADTIVQVAQEEDVGHIVMGTRGLGGVQGLLLGSVATQVIHLAEVPITLIK